MKKINVDSTSANEDWPKHNKKVKAAELKSFDDALALHCKEQEDKSSDKKTVLVKE